jgi:hypothetical protein
MHLKPAFRFFLSGMILVFMALPLANPRIRMLLYAWKVFIKLEKIKLINIYF